MVPILISQVANDGFAPRQNFPESSVILEPPCILLANSGPEQVSAPLCQKSDKTDSQLILHRLEVSF